VHRLAFYELSGLFEPQVVTLTAENDLAYVSTLTEKEAQVVANAIQKRKREFATGRALARQALAYLRRPGVELLSGPDRTPIWPPGISGSISHCDGRAVVAVAEHGTVGIDIEQRRDLKPELWPLVMLPEEIFELEQYGDDEERGQGALLVFSAKEAAYKAQYGWSKQLLDFHAIRVNFDPQPTRATRGGFTCVLQREVPPFAAGSILCGRYRCDAFATGEIVTGVHIEDPDG
jgi:4'-phosphopantetheinyl transferase EntD